MEYLFYINKCLDLIVTMDYAQFAESDLKTRANAIASPVPTLTCANGTRIVALILNSAKR